MHHAAAMRELDGLADGLERGEQAPPREREARALVARTQALQDLMQRAAVHARHRAVVAARGAKADVVDGHDRRVLELALYLGLEEEPRALLRAPRALVLDDLHRDRATDASIDAEPHFAHAALTEQIPDVVPLAELALL